MEGIANGSSLSFAKAFSIGFLEYFSHWRWKLQDSFEFQELDYI